MKCAGLDQLNVFEGKKFDVVMMNNVLEHLPDPEKALNEIRTKVIQSRGLLIIDVPNEFNSFQLAGQQANKLDEWWVAPPGHLNYFSLQTLSNLLKGVGYKVVAHYASFPMEMFLLFGENYVGDQAKGAACHQKRINFELNLINAGFTDLLDQFYHELSKLGLGRQIVVVAQPCSS